MNALLLGVALANLLSPAAPRATDAAATARDFVAFVEQQAHYPQSAKAFIRTEWQRRSTADLSNFIPEALAVLYPRFQAGLQAFERREFSYCAKIMGELSLSTNPYLGTHAALYQSRALLQELHLEYAAMVLQFYLREEFEATRYCTAADEMAFQLGFCQYHTFRSDAARGTLDGFLERFPEADPALRAAAKSMLKDLQQPQPQDLGTASHLMADAGGWLREGDAGLEPQTRQKKALLILEALTRRAEQQEQQNQGQGQQNPQSAQMPSSPAQQSAAPEGPAGTGDLRAAPRAAPGEVWGQMRPQERAKVLQLLQDNFPSRYRELVEQYYNELAKEP